MPHIIVGIDPGKTVGVACLDLNGRFLASFHQISAGPSWIIGEVRRVGIPVLIAGDRPSENHVVRKVNAAFNARAFYPDRALRLEQKREMAKSMEIRNPHERDAYAAALKAYNAYANKLKQADAIAATKDIDDAERTDEIKAKIIRRYSISEAMHNIEANRR